MAVKVLIAILEGAAFPEGAGVVKIAAAAFPEGVGVVTIAPAAFPEGVVVATVADVAFPEGVVGVVAAFPEVGCVSTYSGGGCFENVDEIRK